MTARFIAAAAMLLLSGVVDGQDNALEDPAYLRQREVLRQGWKVVYMWSDADALRNSTRFHMYSYLPRRTKQIRPGVYETWVRHDTEPVVDETGTITSTVTKETVDCSSLRAMTHQQTGYNHDDAVYSFETEDRLLRWRDFVPGSRGESAYMRLCADRAKKAPTGRKKK